jgi:hypothetical protein
MANGPFPYHGRLTQLEVLPVPVLTSCPNCGDEYEVSAGLEGKPVHCRKCRTRFRVKDSEGRTDLPILRAVIWIACVVTVLISGLIYLIGMEKAQSAIQEASLAANACAWMIAAYVIARAVDSATRW